MDPDINPTNIKGFEQLLNVQNVTHAHFNLEWMVRMHAMGTANWSGYIAKILERFPELQREYILLTMEQLDL